MPYTLLCKVSAASTGSSELNKTDFPQRCALMAYPSFNAIVLGRSTHLSLPLGTISVTFISVSEIEIILP